MKPTQRLRQLLDSPEIIVAPGAFGPLPARMIDQEGFAAIYMTGGGTALARHGLADMGLVTMTEMAANDRAMSEITDLPIIADADTGYGNELNVWRTVRQYERAGAAGLHIEDQDFPKKCGAFSGKKLISMDEMSNRIRVAIDARSDPDFAIFARCDALMTHGMEDTLRRCDAYVAAGADGLFIEQLRTMEDIQKVGRYFDVPLIFSMASTGSTPFLSAREVHDLGFKIMIFPNFLTLAAIQSMTTVLQAIKTTGSVADVLDICASFSSFTALSGLADIQKFEDKYGIESTQVT
jgi:2-methylisocitrate lyase-like PEP mutase family enzyme